jgi:hypothetical protein
MKVPENNNGIAIFMCDITGKAAEPWVEAGYHVILIDPQHPAGINTEGRITRVGCIISDALDYLGAVIRTGRVVFAMGFPPCTDVAVSGSKHFEAKRAKDLHFQTRAALVAKECQMIGALAGCPWGFENPVSVFSSIFGKPQHIFSPEQYTNICIADNYTKTTCLWAGGGFVMPEQDMHPKVAEAIAYVIAACGRRLAKPKVREKLGTVALVDEWYPDDRIHKCAPGPDRANIRSASPLGAFTAIYLANAPHLKAAANDNGKAIATA